MKKRIIVFTLILAIVLSMSACGKKEEAFKSEVVNTQGRIENVENNQEMSIYNLSISKDLKIDEGVIKYFKGNPEKAIKKMEPMLLSAARSVRQDMGKIVLSGKNNQEFQWYIIQGLIAAYGGDATSKTKNDITINLDMVAKYFNSCFADFKVPVPKIPKDFATTFDSNTSEFNVPCLDVPLTYFNVTEISLSKEDNVADVDTSAILEIELRDSTQEGNPVYGTAEVEVIKDQKSIYGYSLQSLTYIKK